MPDIKKILKIYEEMLKETELDATATAVLTLGVVFESSFQDFIHSQFEPYKGRPKQS